MTRINTPAIVLLSRAICRAIPMQQAAASSQASLTRTVPPPPLSASMLRSARRALAGGERSIFSALSMARRFLPSPAAGSSCDAFAAAAGRGRGGSSAFSASAFSSAAAADAPRPPPEGTLITSPSNSFVKYCAKLRTSPAERAEAGAALLAGETIILEVCRGSGKGGGLKGEDKNPIAPRVLFLAPGADAPEGVPRALLTLRAPSEVLSKLAGLATTTKSAKGGSTKALTAVAVVDLPREVTFFRPSPTAAEGGAKEAPPSFVRPRRLLALDGVQDPGNVGTLARSALALGWDALFCLPGTADPWGDKALRAARGAAWRLPVRGGGGWDELVEVAREAELDFLVAEPREEGEGGRWPESASRKGKEEQRGLCLVLGSEGSGLSAEGRAALLQLASSSSSSSPSPSVSSVSIPMAGEMESLNVATAGAVLMFALAEGAGDFIRELSGDFVNKHKIK